MVGELVTCGGRAESEGTGFAGVTVAESKGSGVGVFVGRSIGVASSMKKGV